MKMDRLSSQRTIARSISLLVLVMSTALPSASQRSASLPDVARAVSPSVVLIVTRDKNGNLLGRGSGFVVDSNGVIATNLHVIEGAYSASVTLANGDAYDNVLVADADARKDLALLQIKAVDLRAVRLGDSDSVQVGQHVVAVGNPRGLTNSVSDGIVGAVRQEEGMRLLQITAPISPGSSGGMLLNDSGQVIGVTEGTYREENQNLNFAVPVNYLKPMIKFFDPSSVRPLSEFNAGALKTADTIPNTAETRNEPVKADLTLDGAWSATISDGKGSATVRFNLIQSSDGDVVGTYTSSLGGGGRIKGSIKDSQFTFELNQSLQNCPGIFKGNATVDVGKAVGAYTGTDCLGDHGKGSLTMSRSGAAGEPAIKNAPDDHTKIVDDAPTGSYTGVWQSSKFAVSGAAQMTIRIANGTANAEIFLTGGEVTSAVLNGPADKTGENIWTIQLSSKKPRLSVRGIFRGNSFVGDYVYCRFRMLDHGRWILKKE